jgi:hypothetical protein
MHPFRRSLLLVSCAVALSHCQSQSVPFKGFATIIDGGFVDLYDARAASGAHAGNTAASQTDGSPASDSGPESDAALSGDASMPHADAGAMTADAAPRDAAPGDASRPDAEPGDAAPATQGSSMIVAVNSWGMRARSADGGAFVICRNAETSDDHTPDLLRDIGYGAGVFIAVGGDLNSMVMRSLDAVHWQEDLHPTKGCSDPSFPSSCTNWMGGIAFADGVWLAGGGNGAVMRSKDAGLTWQGVHPAVTPTPIRHMAAGSGRFVAGGDAGAVFVSADAGDSWKRFDLWSDHSQAQGMRVAHGAGSFIAWGSWYNGNGFDKSCFVSVDKGDHWKACDASVATSTSFVYDGTRWVTQVAKGYATSTDGVAWTQHTASGVPSELLFDGTTWFGSSGTTLSRGASPDTFKSIPTVTVPDFRAWTIGLVLDANLPVTGIAACTDKS